MSAAAEYRRALAPFGDGEQPDDLGGRCRYCASCDHAAHRCPYRSAGHREPQIVRAALRHAVGVCIATFGPLAVRP